MYVLYTPRSPLCMYCTLLNPLYVCTVHSSIPSMYVLYTPLSPLCMYCTLLNPLYICTVHSSIPSMYVLYTPLSPLCMYCTLLNPLYICTVHSSIPSMYVLYTPQSPLCMYCTLLNPLYVQYQTKITYATRVTFLHGRRQNNACSQEIYASIVSWSHKNNTLEHVLYHACAQESITTWHKCCNEEIVFVLISFFYGTFIMD